MRRTSIFACALLVALAAGDAVSAQQMIPPGASQFSPPPPAPPPSPKIEVPAVPQLDAPPRQNFQAAPRASFSDRIETCLDEGAAAGLNPGDRAAYSRSCANQ
jgi:hypothetical protein